MPDQMQEGTAITLAVDTASRASLAPAPLPLAETVGAGLIRVEVDATCLRHLVHDDPALPARRLRRIADARHLLRVATRLSGTVTVAGLDGRGRLFLREAPFDSATDAEAWLRGRRGDCIVARIDAVRIEPPASALDPFSESIPVAGSFLVARNDEVRGPFVEPGDMLAEWTFSHFPSGYYAAVLLARCAAFDNGDRRPGTGRLRAAEAGTAPGRYHVFEQQDDERPTLALITPERTAAEDYIHNRPGRLLLARCIETLDMR